VVFNNIPIDNCWWRRRSTRVITRAAVGDTQDQSCAARWRVRSIAFLIDDVAEMLKNATHFCL